MRLHYSEAEATKFPLHLLLVLYESGASTALYNNYMEGLQLLVDWLGPIGIPELPSIPIPRICGNYDVQRISHIVGCDESIVYQVARLLYDPIST